MDKWMLTFSAEYINLRLDYLWHSCSHHSWLRHSYILHAFSIASVFGTAFRLHYPDKQKAKTSQKNLITNETDLYLQLNGWCSESEMKPFMWDCCLLCALLHSIQEQMQTFSHPDAIQACRWLGFNTKVGGCSKQEKERLRLFITHLYSGKTYKQPRGRTTWGHYIMGDGVSISILFDKCIWKEIPAYKFPRLLPTSPAWLWYMT